MRSVRGVAPALGITLPLLTLACASASAPLAPAGPAPAAARAQPEMTPAAGAADTAQIPDATVTDPDKYRPVMENARVRVLRYHDVPGARTRLHRHPDSVLYALSAFRRRLHFPDGTSRERQFHAGDVMWIPRQAHVGENIGATATEVLLVEIKER